jgi:hypothetical protein
VTRESSSSCAALATWSTARPNAIWFALEGRVKPLNFRTNCREEARISSSVADSRADLAAVRKALYGFLDDHLR